jgi:hypothetical protein
MNTEPSPVHTVCWYGGEAGDKRNLIDTYKATSGYRGPDANGKTWNLQKAKYQNVRNGGPTPEGKYHVNLEPNPERVAKADINTGDLLRDPNGGIERIPDFVENPNKQGYGWTYCSAFGKKCIYTLLRQLAYRSSGTHTGYRDRHSGYTAYLPCVS